MFTAKIYAWQDDCIEDDNIYEVTLCFCDEITDTRARLAHPADVYYTPAPTWAHP